MGIVNKRTPTNPDKDLTEFLAALPAAKRKEFEHGLFSFTQNDLDQWQAWEAANPELSAAFSREHIRLLSRIPAKMREYRERMKRETQKLNQQLMEFVLPKVPKGKPRLDELASEAKELKNAGLSWRQVAQRLNQIYGTEITTPENVRALLRSRKAIAPPDEN